MRPKPLIATLTILNRIYNMLNIHFLTNRCDLLQKRCKNKKKMMKLNIFADEKKLDEGKSEYIDYKR